MRKSEAEYYWFMNNEVTHAFTVILNFSCGLISKMGLIVASWLPYFIGPFKERLVCC
jgi:hypothetical protein